MAGETYDVGVRVGSSSDDAALEQFNAHLNKVLKDSAKLSETLKALSDSFKTEGESAEDAADKTEKAGKKAEEAKSKFGELKDGLMDLGQKLLALVALEKLGEWLFEGAKGAATEERALRQVSEAAERLGLSGPKAAEAAERLATSLLKIGIDESDTYGMFREMVNVLGDLEQAESAVSLAANVAAANDRSLGEVQSVIIGLIQGRKGALREAQKLGAEGAKTEQEALDKLTKTQGDYINNLSDAKAEQAAFKAELDNMAEEIGGPINKAISWLIDAFHGIIWAIERMGSAAVISFGVLFDQVKKVGGVFQDFDFEHPLESLKKINSAIGDSVKGTWKQVKQEVRAAWDEIDAEAADKWGGAGAKTPTPGHIKTRKPEKDGGGAGGAEKESKAEQDLAKAILEVRDAEVAEAKAAAEAADSKEDNLAAHKKLAIAINEQKKAESDLLAVEQSYASKAAKTDADRLAVANTFTAKRIALDKKYGAEHVKITKEWAARDYEIDKKRTAQEAAEDKKRQKNAIKYIDLRVKAEEMANKKTLKALQKADAAELKEKKKEYTATLQAMERSELQWTDEYKALSRARAEIAKMESQLRLQAQLGEWSQIIGSLGEMFKIQKAVAIAQGLINVYLAATNAATKGDPYTTALRVAAAIVATMAQVMAMKSVSVGSDSGQVAKAAGGALFDRPAMSWVGEAGPELVLPTRFTRMFESMSRDYARSGNTYITHGSTDKSRVNMPININTLSGSTGKRVIEDLARKIDRAAPAVDRLRLSQPRVKRGSARRVNQ